ARARVPRRGLRSSFTGVRVLARSSRVGSTAVDPEGDASSRSERAGRAERLSHHRTTARGVVDRGPADYRTPESDSTAGSAAWSHAGWRGAVYLWARRAAPD